MLGEVQGGGLPPSFMSKGKATGPPTAPVAGERACFAALWLSLWIAERCSGKLALAKRFLLR
jgi:hypothetical protein